MAESFSPLQPGRASAASMAASCCNSSVTFQSPQAGESLCSLFSCSWLARTLSVPSSRGDPLQQADDLPIPRYFQSTLPGRPRRNSSRVYAMLRIKYILVPYSQSRVLQALWYSYNRSLGSQRREKGKLGDAVTLAMLHAPQPFFFAALHRHRCPIAQNARHDRP